MSQQDLKPPRKIAFQLGHLLAVCRVQRGMTQTDLAERTKLKPCAISHFESCRRLPSLPNFVKLCRAMNLSADELLGTGKWVP